MTKNDAHLRLGLLAIVRYLCLVAPPLLVSEGLIFWAGGIMGAEIDFFGWLCAFSLGIVAMFTLGDRLQAYFMRRTKGIRKRALDALKGDRS